MKVIILQGKVDAIGGYEELVAKGFDLLAIVEDKASKNTNESKSKVEKDSNRTTTEAEAVTTEETISSYSGSTTSLDSLVSKSSDVDPNEVH